MFSYTLASDELWIQTILYNTEFKNTIYRIDDLKEQCMRFIDWNRGKPYTWGQQEGDYKMLMDSPYLFARKFDENTNLEIVEKIYETLNRANRMEI